MKLGKWTIVVPDKRIIKQYDNNQSIGYEIEDNNFWINNLNSNIRAIQYTGDNSDLEQVEHNDGTPHSNFTGDIKIFADAWDKEHLKYLQLLWDNNRLSDNGNLVQETIEQKTARLGIRPSNYTSENIY
jgi:hypothetical protein